MKSPSSTHPYREASEPAADEEAAALLRIVSKARRLRRLVGLPILLTGVVAAVVGYRMLARALMSAVYVRAPSITILVTALPIAALLLGLTLAAHAGRHAVRVRASAWIRESATAVSPALLEAFVRLL